MASKRAAATTPLSSEPVTRQMVLRNRLTAISDNSSDLAEHGGRRGGRRGRGGMGRGSGPILNENEQIMEQGIGRGDCVGRRDGVVSDMNNQNLASISENLEQVNLDTNILQNENAAESNGALEKESFSITQMLNMSKDNKFPKKSVLFGSKEKFYTPVLHFFKHKSQFQVKPSKKIKFECKEDGCILHEAFGDLSNLNHHLTKHVKTKKWYELYKKRNDDGSESNLIGISETKLLLIKFFVTSNLALKQLENVYLRKCLKDEIKMPCIKTFKFTYLVEVFNKMKCLISEKCKEATYITLVPDGWSDDLNSHYLGIGLR
jgi:hypothetical protein